MQQGVLVLPAAYATGGGRPDLCAGGVFMLFAPPLCAWVRGGLSSWQKRNDHDHMLEPRLTLGPTTHYIGSPRGTDTQHFKRLEPGGQSYFDGKGPTSAKTLSRGDHGVGSGRLDTSRNDDNGGGGGRGRAW